MNNLELLEYCKKIYEVPNHYMYGTFGRKITQALIDAKVRQYPAYYTKNRIEACKKAIGKFGFDCVGLIKSFYWGGIDNIKYEASTDVGANGMYNRAKIKGTITTIHRSRKGLCVHMNGHVGVYDGNGGVYESTVFDNAYKIIHTKLDERKWEHWFECPYINYIKDTPPINDPTPTQTTPISNTNDLSDKELLDLVRNTIKGVFGNGQIRKQKLGSNYKRVQDQVNLNIKNKTTRWDNVRLY